MSSVSVCCARQFLFGEGVRVIVDCIRVLFVVVELS